MPFERPESEFAHMSLSYAARAPVGRAPAGDRLPALPTEVLEDASCTTTCVRTGVPGQSVPSKDCLGTHLPLGYAIV